VGARGSSARVIKLDGYYSREARSVEVGQMAELEEGVEKSTVIVPR